MKGLRINLDNLISNNNGNSSNFLLSKKLSGSTPCFSNNNERYYRSLSFINNSKHNNTNENNKWSLLTTFINHPNNNNNIEDRNATKSVDLLHMRKARGIIVSNPIKNLLKNISNYLILLTITIMKSLKKKKSLNLYYHQISQLKNDIIIELNKFFFPLYLNYLYYIL